MATRRRMNNEINAGSMADIAFLLLIFFLVTTTISEDKGVLVKLPEWSPESPPPLPIHERNVFSVLVNAQNQLLVRGKAMDIADLKNSTKILRITLQNLSNQTLRATQLPLRYKTIDVRLNNFR